MKGPKYRFPVQIDFQKCRERIAGSLNAFCNRWCKREHVECDALKDWKLNIFNHLLTIYKITKWHKTEKNCRKSNSSQSKSVHTLFVPSFVK